jgi:hypothetical protein
MLHALMMALNWHADQKANPSYGRPVFRLVDRKKNGHYGQSNNTLNFYDLMAVRAHRNAFFHFGRNLVRRHPQSDRFGNAECLAIGIPVVEFNATGIS